MRNINDDLRHMPTEEIREKLQSEAFPFAACMQHWKGDYNIGMLVRNANAFGAEKVFYFGKKKWDRRHSVGTHHYTDLIHIGFEEFQELLEEYTIVGFDNVVGSVPLETFEWPEGKVLMVFGEEQEGMTEDVQAACDHLVAITQYGSVRSLNAGTASAIAMYDYHLKRLR